MSNLPNKSILIVDDESMVLEMHKDYFDQKDIKSSCFTEPQKAIDYFKEHEDEIDLILSDFNMPGMSGLEMMRTVHQRKEVPFFLFSGELDQIEDNYSEHQIGRFNKPDQIFDLYRALEAFFIKDKN